MDSNPNLARGLQLISDDILLNGFVEMLRLTEVLQRNPSRTATALQEELYLALAAVMDELRDRKLDPLRFGISPSRLTSLKLGAEIIRDGSTREARSSTAVRTEASTAA